MSATNALLYLYGTSLRNSLVQRFKRLRQPKYLAGAIVGGLYFYFFLLRNIWPRNAPADVPAATDLANRYLPFAALLLLIAVVLSWVVPSSRASLQFTEAGVAFLFPAPLTRKMLIHAQLLRSQIVTFFSALFLTFVLRRGTAFGGNTFTHAVGWWIYLSTFRLHRLGASFVREWMLELGLSPARRRLVLLGILAVLLTGGWLLVRHSIPALTDSDTVSYSSMVRYIDRVFSTGPIMWLLAPFQMVVAPYFASTWTAFLVALGPALALLALHYFWVMRIDVAFEDASIEVAAKNAARLAAYRAGRWRGTNAPKKPRSEPFPLAARGWIAMAYLWKNLIALGPFYRLRTWLIACAVAVAGISWIATDPSRLPILKFVGAVALMFSIWTAVLIPMLMRREMQQTLEYMDIVKSYPLPGWQVVLGGLVTPMVLMVFIEWFLLLVAVLALGSNTQDRVLVLILGSAGAGGVALLLPPLCGLMLCIPFGGVLYFPAWAQPTGTQSAGGVEILGQRLIFFFGFLVLLVVAVLPAALPAALVFFFVYLGYLGLLTAALISAVLACVILCAELVTAVYWLGQKVETFDLSAELPR